MNDLRGFAEGPPVRLGSDMGGLVNDPLCYRAGTDCAGFAHSLAVAGPAWQAVVWPAAFAIIGYGAGVFLAVPAGASQGTAYRSTDQGLTWQSVALGSTAGDWRQVLTDDHGTWLVVAGNSSASSSYVRSTDHGRTWQSLTLPASMYWYAASYSNHRFYLQRYDYNAQNYGSDDGLVWELLGTGGGAANRIILGNGRGVLISKADNSDIFSYSQDHGKTWASISVNLASSTYRAAYEKGLFLVPRCSTTSGPSGMFVSDDQGKNWRFYAMPLGTTRKWYDVKRLFNVLVSNTLDGADIALSLDGTTWALAQNSLPAGLVGNAMTVGAGVILICNSTTSGSRGTVA